MAQGPPDGLPRVAPRRGHPRRQTALQPRHAPHMADQIPEGLPDPPDGEQPHRPHAHQEPLHRPAASAPQVIELEKQPQGQQGDAQQRPPDRPPQQLLPGPGLGGGIRVQVRGRGVEAVVDQIVPQGTGPTPAHAGVQLVRLLLLCLGPLALGVQPHPAVTGLHPLKQREGAPLHQDPAPGCPFLQPSLDGAHVPQVHRCQKAPVVFHGSSLLSVPGSARSAARSSRSPSPTHNRKRESSCRNRARPRSVMA